MTTMLVPSSCRSSLLSPSVGLACPTPPPRSDDDGKRTGRGEEKELRLHCVQASLRRYVEVSAAEALAQLTDETGSRCRARTVKPSARRRLLPYGVQEADPHLPTSALRRVGFGASGDSWAGGGGQHGRPLCVRMCRAAEQLRVW